MPEEILEHRLRPTVRLQPAAPWQTAWSLLTLIEAGLRRAGQHHEALVFRERASREAWVALDADLDLRLVLKVANDYALITFKPVEA